MKITIVCSKCGKEPEKDKEKSNQNWTVFDSKCKHCGGRLKPKLNE